MLLRLSSLNKTRWKQANASTRRSLQTVAIQLDYYMSSQFAGIASAMTHNLYEKSGLDVQFLPICPVGLEMERVREHVRANTNQVTVGSVEQNIFVPTLYAQPDLRVKAIAAMFRRSPLALSSLVVAGEDKQAQQDPLVVGAHEDTVELIQRILQNDDKYRVIASPRATKNTDLTSGQLDAIQTYVTTEVLTLERQLGKANVIATPLEGLNGAKLGYSQMLFAPDEQLIEQDQREVIQTFLETTFDGWEVAIRDTEAAAHSVNEARAMLGLDEESNDHWEASMEYQRQSVELCCDFVKETFQGDRYGTLNSKRWKDAAEWLLDGKSVDASFGLDSTVWQPPSHLLAGNELARGTLQEAKESAEKFTEAHGRKPSLAIVTVGDLPRYAHGDRRVKLYSNKVNSWFSKSEVGADNGFDVEEIQLPSATTTDQLLSQLYALRNVDGIQLMWPLPDHIDASKVYNSIDVLQDVDGAHYIGQVELDPLHKSSSPIPPVTPAAVCGLMDAYDIDVKNKNFLVVGRSRIVGSPMSHMLRERDAAVTVVHSEVAPDKLQELVGGADVVVSCAGSPGTLQSKWLKEGATVINVGSTFSEEKDCLVSDFDGLLEDVAGKYSPVPGGVGPLSVAYLLKHTIEAAWKREAAVGDVEKEWNRVPGSLSRAFHFEDYDAAMLFADKVNEMSRKLDHHANMKFEHQCVDGVDVNLEFFTFENKDVTEKDYIAARSVNEIFDGEQIRMSDYTVRNN